jgi:hypothetical protein
MRVVGRRWVVAAVVALQLAFVVAAYSSDHKVFGFQMFPEASTWSAEVVRVTADGRRIPVERPWAGYRWEELVRGSGSLQYPSARHHADAGLDNQLAFLDVALDYVAEHTPNDTDTAYLEADVTYWKNAHPPQHVVLTSERREESR